MTSSTATGNLSNLKGLNTRSHRELPSPNSSGSDSNTPSISSGVEDSEFLSNSRRSTPPMVRRSYNLRSKKRKYREMNGSNGTSNGISDGISNADSNGKRDGQSMHIDHGTTSTSTLTATPSTTTTTTMRQSVQSTPKRMVYRKRPTFLRSTDTTTPPNTVCLAPSASPTKLTKSLKAIHLDNGTGTGSQRTSSTSTSAPNTPLMGSFRGKRRGNGSNAAHRSPTQIINLVQSPKEESTPRTASGPSPLHFPQITLPQGQCSILGPMAPSNGQQRGSMALYPMTMNGRNLQQIQQIQRLILLQKRMSDQNAIRNLGISPNMNRNGTTSVPAPPSLPRLEAETDWKPNGKDVGNENEDESISTDSMQNEPPTKKQRISSPFGGNPTTESFQRERLLSDSLSNFACFECNGFFL